MKYNFIFAFLFLLVFLDQIQTIKQNNKPLTTVDTSYHWKLVKVKDIPNYPEYEVKITIFRFFSLKLSRRVAIRIFFCHLLEDLFLSWFFSTILTKKFKL